MQINNIVIPSAWKLILHPNVVTLGEKLAERAAQERLAGKIIYPEQENIFRALELTAPEDVKCLILGQDPYHGQGQANGLAFSVNYGIKLPPSLKNIFSELSADIGCSVPRSGNLSCWAKQGVLLLNTSLTVEEGKPNSHADWGWQAFTKAVFQAVLDLPQPVVIMLWGNSAQKFVTDINFSVYPNKRVIVSTHPSPLAAYRASKDAPAFIGSKPFSWANEMLEDMSVGPINW